MTTARHRIAIEPVAADDERALRDWFELDAAALAVDRPADPPPCWTDRRASLSAPWPGQEPRLWLARTAGTVVGGARLGLPILDNLGNASGDVLVAPRHRRAGVGTALWEHLVEAARAAGRVRLAAEVCETPVCGPAFAARTGAVRALAEQRRRLVLPPDEAVLARLATEARAAAAADYELVTWTGATPERHVDDLAYLTGRMSTDAPLGDLHIEPTRYDAARIRAREAMEAARGNRVTVTGALHAASGRLVAFTDIAVHAGVPTHGYQRDTLVDPSHRGHRLGMLVKLANLSRVRAEHPRLAAITTWNADANPYMVAINEAIGFRPLDAWTEWEVDLRQAGSSGASSSAASGP